MKGKLTAKQQRFVDEYVVDCNATQAAIRAGYSAKTAGSAGARAMQNAAITAGIKLKQAETAKKTETDAEYVRRMYQEIAEMAIEDRDPSAARGCFDSISRLNGLFVDKSEIQHSGKVSYSVKK
jgi:phage terminase small subunit